MNPFSYIDIRCETELLKHIPAKRDMNPLMLKMFALETIYTRYPIAEWLHI